MRRESMNLDIGSMKYVGKITGSKTGSYVSLMIPKVMDTATLLKKALTGEVRNGFVSLMQTSAIPIPTSRGSLTKCLMLIWRWLNVAASLLLVGLLVPLAVCLLRNMLAGELDTLSLILTLVFVFSAGVYTITLEHIFPTNIPLLRPLLYCLLLTILGLVIFLASTNTEGVKVNLNHSNSSTSLGQSIDAKN